MAEIPKLAIGAIKRYVKDGLPPGGFLRAVLANDLRDAISRADPVSLDTLKELVRYVESNVPMNCCGSPAVVDGWIWYQAAKRIAAKTDHNLTQAERDGMLDEAQRVWTSAVKDRMAR